jgi:NitT/TauT family transport system ATP-binding protein
MNEETNVLTTESSVLTPACVPVADPAPARARVVVEGVARSFLTKTGELFALREVDFSVPDGQFCSLVGPSGCGKTTLLRIIAGLTQPTSGRVTIRHDDPARQARSVVFQDYSVYPWKTVRGNVELPLRANGTSKKNAREIASRWLHHVGLDGFEDAWPSHLSGGMRQRVAIARAFASDPEMLLMDEPLAALDAQMRLLLQEQLLTLTQEQKKTSIFVTHSIEEAVLLSDRVIVMGARPGRVIADIPVPFDRPRNPTEVRREAHFSELHEQIWQLVRSEVEQQIKSESRG